MKVLILGDNNLTKRVTNALIKNNVEVSLKAEATEVVNMFRKENFDLTLVDSYIRNAQEIYQSLNFLNRTYMALLINESPEERSRIQSMNMEAFSYDEFDDPEMVEKLDAIILRRKDRMTKIKILVVEDEPYIARAIDVSIRKNWPSADVYHAANGQTGIKLACSKPVDIIILDIKLPDINGFEVLQAIRLFSSTPVIMSTADKVQDDIVKSVQFGANDYLIKPFKQEDLIYHIRKNLEPTTNL